MQGVFGGSSRPGAGSAWWLQQEEAGLRSVPLSPSLEAWSP